MNFRTAFTITAVLATLQGSMISNAFAQNANASSPVQTQWLMDRNQFRAAEAKAGGFRWTPWLSAGERIWKYILVRDPKAKDLIGNGQGVDVAVKDLNFDGNNEVILNFWEGCGTDGCLYVIYFNGSRRPVFLTGHSMEPFGQGVKLDARYIKL